jgi:two-component system, OmpR family, response regulator VicR
MSQPHNGKRILVVNDEPAVLDLFRELLEEEGYRVSLDKFERPTQELLETVKEVRPDLVILDFIIGGEGKGWQLLQVLKMERSTKEIPVIVCTGAVKQVTEMSAHLNELGIQVVLKPFDIDHLLEIVSKVWKIEASAAVGPDTLGSEETN